MRYDRNGDQIDVLRFPATQTTCPAFGGPDLATLFVTSATEALDSDALADQPDAGRTFATQTGVKGLHEYRVTL